MPQHPLTHISFSGGGCFGFSYLGVIHYLQLNQMLGHLHHVSGTSIGSIFAVFLAMGIPVDNLFMYIKRWIENQENLIIDGRQFLDIFTQKGIDDGTRFIQCLQWAFEDAYQVDDITFLDLCKKTGIIVSICATCIETGKATYFSVDTTPNVSVIEAVRASMAIPMFVIPVKIGDYHYVDGAVSKNHPISIFGDPLPPSCLAVKVTSKLQTIDHVPENVFQYMNRLFGIFFHYADQEYLKSKYHILLDDPPCGFLDMEYKKPNLHISITVEDIEKSILYGFQKTYEFAYRLSTSVSC